LANRLRFHDATDDYRIVEHSLSERRS